MLSLGRRWGVVYSSSRSSADVGEIRVDQIGFRPALNDRRAHCWKKIRRTVTPIVETLHSSDTWRVGLHFSLLMSLNKISTKIFAPVHRFRQTRVRFQGTFKPNWEYHVVSEIGCGWHSSEYSITTNTDLPVELKKTLTDSYFRRRLKYELLTLLVYQKAPAIHVLTCCKQIR